ncbi:hypothetical protein GCM10007857_78520 [Bradyrhizobium iriomotense]|uniref:Transposase IS110-like N-terminal domain-containing protein n=1 Tax=Bradyrhizobium iriomotense TaxID=441950 RepID=A0ABQ6BBC5_9BRAD|nr:hypothetical protein GCM10007857_78520 [Bradyrhizobium iriomotense]
MRPYSKGQKNDFRDAKVIAEAVQRPAMKFVATKTADQLDLQALHRVRNRLVGQRTGVINQIRAFLLERGIAVRQGLHSLRSESPGSPGYGFHTSDPQPVLVGACGTLHGYNLSAPLGRHQGALVSFTSSGGKAGRSS